MAQDRPRKHTRGKTPPPTEPAQDEPQDRAEDVARDRDGLVLRDEAGKPVPLDDPRVTDAVGGK